MFIEYVNRDSLLENSGLPVIPNPIHNPNFMSAIPEFRCPPGMMGETGNLLILRYFGSSLIDTLKYPVDGKPTDDWYSTRALQVMKPEDRRYAISFELPRGRSGVLLDQKPNSQKRLSWLDLKEFSKATRAKRKFYHP
jgi:hypothetical protein